jgi:hypothetical protein
MKVVVCVEVPYEHARRFAKCCELPFLDLGIMIKAHVQGDVWYVRVNEINVSTESQMLIAYCDFEYEGMSLDYLENPGKCEKIFLAFKEDLSWRPFGDYPRDAGIPDGPSEKDCLEMLGLSQ